MRLIVFIFVLLFCGTLHAGEIDSLKRALSVKSQADTTKGNLCAGIAYGYYTSDGMLDSSLKYYELSLKFYVRAQNDSKISHAYAGLGLIYREKGIYDKALEHYLEAHKYGLKANDPKKISKALVGIGVVHNIQADYEKALYYYGEAEKLYVKHNNEAGLASVYNNMGLAYTDKTNHEKAIEYFNKALKINKTLKDKRGIATNCENLGLIYLNHLNDANLALKNFSTSMALWRSMGDRFSVSITLQYISAALYKMKQYQRCIDSASLSLQLALESKSMSSEMAAHEWLYRAYEGMGNKEMAYTHFKNFVGIKDSLNNSNEIRKIAELQLNYDFDKQRVLDSVNSELKHQVEVDKKQFELDKQKQYSTWLILGLAFMLAGILAIFFVLQKNRKAHKEIARQKLLIEQRNTEVMDSIKYASRIQQAILPPGEQIAKTLPEHFIVYMPKDIVSGDFYWIEEKGDFVFIAVVDCTGHGVPGAFMSIVGRNGLNDAVNIAKLTSASDILDFLNRNVNETLHQTYDQSNVRDGMDISLCVWNKRTNTIDFAGANNPVWLRKQRSTEIIEVNGDKQPIGNFIGHDMKPFRSQQIQLEKGDIFYLFSDGYADQFGGPKKKKLKYKRLKQILGEIASKEIAKQGEHLSAFITEWRGDLEQVDDICVVGVKI